MILDTDYTFIYLIVIINVYFLSFARVIQIYKLDNIGKVFIVLSILSCMLLFIYRLHEAFLSDTEDLVFGTIGIFDALLFTHPYIFLILAVLIGSNGKK